MKKFTVVAVVLLLVIVLSQGCGKKADPAASQVKWTIGMSQCNLGEPWRVQMNADVAAAANKHEDIKVIFKDAQNDTLKQRSRLAANAAKYAPCAPGSL